MNSRLLTCLSESFKVGLINEFQGLWKPPEPGKMLLVLGYVHFSNESIYGFMGS